MNTTAKVTTAPAPSSCEGSPARPIQLKLLSTSMVAKMLSVPEGTLRYCLSRFANAWLVSRRNSVLEMRTNCGSTLLVAAGKSRSMRSITHYKRAAPSEAGYIFADCFSSHPILLALGRRSIHFATGANQSGTLTSVFCWSVIA
jgi:hypothetical protein